MEDPRFKLHDRVKPFKGSSIYIVDGMIYDEQEQEYVYQVHSLVSDTPKVYMEHELVFAGYNFMK